MSDKLLQVEHLKQYFPAGGMGKNRKFVKAVDDVSFFVNKGETLGLVGESGCGNHHRTFYLTIIRAHRR